MAVGEVAPSHLEHAPDAEHLAHTRGRGDEAEVEDASLRRDARRRRAGPRSCRAGPSDWRSGSADDVPAEALARVDQPFVVELLERAADRDPARGEGLRELRLARQQPAARELAGRHPPAQLARDLLVADVTHLSYTCLHQVDTPAHTLTRGAAAMAVSRLPPRSSSSSRSTTASRPGSRRPGGRSGARSRWPRRSSSTTCANPERPVGSLRARPQLRRLRSRPRRAAGRARADRRAPVHERGPRRAPSCRRRCTATISSRRAVAAPADLAGRARRQRRGLRLPAHARARSTASASGSPARGSSTRSCSRTTRSRAG